VKTLTVVAPVYNEEALVGLFYEALKEVLASLSDSYEATVIFVVDRSEDRTLEILREIAARDPQVVVLSLSSRFGHQMSLRAGLDHADGDAVITMDSDLEHPPDVIPVLLQRFEEGYEVVQAVRLDLPGSPLLKRKGSKLFYRLVNRLADVQIAESGADFRLLSARVVSIFREEIGERNQFLRGLVAWVGFLSCTVTYTPGQRSAGRSKYSLPRMIRLGVDGIVSFSRRPLQAAALFGMLFATVAFAFGIFTVITYFVSAHLPPGWATLAILVTFFSGIQLIFLGVIGEYIGTIFDEVKRRPHYLVDEAINLRHAAHGKVLSVPFGE
jgi:polyisoprenyl-phosphate glycosyltransferase